jgi:hypothetical protein
LARARDFSLIHILLPSGYGRLSAGVKGPGREAIHPPTYGAEVKKYGAVMSWRWSELRYTLFIHYW